MLTKNYWIKLGGIVPKIKSRADWVRCIRTIANLPPGKESEDYFTKRQLERLAVVLTTLQQENTQMRNQLAKMTERQLTNGRVLQPSESEGL